MCVNHEENIWKSKNVNLDMIRHCWLFIFFYIFLTMSLNIFLELKFCYSNRTYFYLDRKLNCFFIVELWEFLHILATNPLSEIWFANTSLHSVGYLILSWCPLKHRSFNFNEIQLIFFHSSLVLLIRCLTNYCLILGHKDLLPSFLRVL